MLHHVALRRLKKGGWKTGAEVGSECMQGAASETPESLHEKMRTFDLQESASTLASASLTAWY